MVQSACVDFLCLFSFIIFVVSTIKAPLAVRLPAVASSCHRAFLRSSSVWPSRAAFARGGHDDRKSCVCAVVARGLRGQHCGSTIADQSHRETHNIVLMVWCRWLRASLTKTMQRQIQTQRVTSTKLVSRADATRAQSAKEDDTIGKLARTQQRMEQIN